MEKRTQIKDAKLQQPKGIFLYPALVDSLVGKMAGFKTTKTNTLPTPKIKKKPRPNQNTHAKSHNSTGIPTCWKLYSS